MLSSTSVDANAGGIMATKKKTVKKKAVLSTKRAAKKPAAKKPATKKVAAKKVAKKSARKASAKPVHPIVHWEIQSQDAAKLCEFYASALGWSIDANNPMNYGMVSSKGRGGINGGIGGSPAPGSRVTVYASVPSIPKVLERIQSLGGTTIMPRTDVGPVIMALYHDPEGNLMGLIEG
jgi:predicted enzyme related to lactoylglutathione lyase